MRNLPRITIVLGLSGISAGCFPDGATIPEPDSFLSSRAADGLTLSDPARSVQWSGTSRLDGASLSDIPECASTACYRFDLTVDLPEGVWNNRPGGVQVALRWEGFGNNLDLFVYREGALVAASDGIIATAQSVLIPGAENGEYQVYVAHDHDMAAEFGVQPGEVIPFEALAEVEYSPRPYPLRALLPDLAARPQRNVTFQVPDPIFFEAGVPESSCFPSEIEEEGAQLCLRFDQVLANIGEGPLEFLFRLPADPYATPEGGIAQRIYRSDGTVTERTGGTWEYHPTHEHFHYTGFAVSRLWAVDDSGRRGNAPLRVHHHQPGVAESPVRTGRKVSFCIVDIEIDAWGLKGDAPRTYNAPACLIPNDDGHLLQGISAGWTDVYDWFLPDQYIEVSGLPDGLYLLDTIVDPDDTILEADETNNCGAVYVRLSGMASGNPVATLVGEAPGCVN